MIFGTILGARAWRDRPPSLRPAPPTWTIGRTTTPLTPVTTATPSTLAKPAASAAKESPGAVPAEPPSPSAEVTTPSAAVREPERPEPADLERPARRHKRMSHPVQYTRDGVPLLPAN
jgi:hypothetical protein